jgi:YHS domain-containing protein
VKNGLKTDPVCQMEVREEEAVTADCDRTVYYLGSEGCWDKFLEDRTCAPTSYNLPRPPWRPGSTCLTC